MDLIEHSASPTRVKNQVRFAPGWTPLGDPVEPKISPETLHSEGGPGATVLKTSPSGI
jgi:hypothetical protein